MFQLLCFHVLLVELMYSEWLGFVLCWCEIVEWKSFDADWILGRKKLSPGSKVFARDNWVIGMLVHVCEGADVTSDDDGNMMESWNSQIIED